MTIVQTFSSSTMTTTSSTAHLSRQPPPNGQHSHAPQDKSIMTIRGGPPTSNTRTSLPQIQSKFDLEPNPFEQSFKDNPSEAIRSTAPNTISPSLDHLLNGTRPRRTRSSSPHHLTSGNCPTPPAIRQSPDNTLAKVSLPGISFITSPAILVHHTGANNSKSLSPTSLAVSHSAQSSRPSSMLAYPWNFGALGDSLRTGPLSPALLDGPAPTGATPPAAHTGLTPLLDSGGTITPGTQALIALLSGNENSNGIQASTGGQDQSASSTAIKSSNNPIEMASQTQSGHPINLAQQVDQSLRSTIGINTPSTNSESLSAASHRSAGAIFPSAASLPADPTSKSSTTSASVFKELVNTSVSVTCSPPSASTTLDPIKSNILSSHSRLASVSSTAVSASSSSSSSNSLHVKPEFPPNSCAQSSISLGPSGVKTLHSVSSLGLSQPALSSTASFPCTATTSRGSFAQSTIPLPIPTAPPMQPSAEITAPLSPTPASRSIITPLPPNSGGCIDDQYNTNPLYLLTVAHEASSRLSQLSNSHDSLDDATATAAAALTGLGSSGGSRYSSPVPSINPNGAIKSQHVALSNIAGSQAVLLSHDGDVPSASSPRLSSLRPNASADSSSINPRAILCADNEPNLLPAHLGPSFAIERREQPPNSMLADGTPIASGSTMLPNQTSYSTRNLGSITSTSLDSSAAKKKGKKRKESGDVERDHAPRLDMGDSQFLRSRSEVQSSPCVIGPTALRGTAKAARTTAPPHKTKKSKKAKAEELSGDDSDSRDGYWGPEDDTSFMRQQGGEEGDSGGYPMQSISNSNYNPNNPPATTQGSSIGKPETEEEKRKNFLERNRQAALKCRQRKKAWLANLQTKIEFLSTENESLQSTINRLREEIDSFRNILISHKDCPINIAGGRGASATIGELMGHDSGFAAANAAAVLNQQNHENNGRVTMRHPPGPNALHGQAHIAATLSSGNGPIRRSHHNPHGAVVSSFGY